MQVGAFKRSKGSVGVESFQGKLRIRLPRTLSREEFNVKQKYIPTGLDDTPEGRKLAEAKAKTIENDIQQKQFDPTLNKYLPSYIQVVTPTATETLTFFELWEKFKEHKFNSGIANTTKSKYESTTTALRKYGKDIKMLSDVHDFVEHERSLGKNDQTIKDRLIHLRHCANWGMQWGLLENTMFSVPLKEIVKPKRPEKEKPFSDAEIKAIIQAFENDRYYSHYTPFVKFLFQTGCRISEAIGLRWKHVGHNFAFVEFCESLTRGERRGTKTGVSRRIPCNDKLRELLASIKPENPNPDDLVFPSPRTGQGIDDHNFSQRAWKRVLEQAEVEYRRPYNCRHTFISHMINKTDIKIPQLAKLVGNRPEVLMKHYALELSNATIPDLI